MANMIASLGATGASGVSGIYESGEFGYVNFAAADSEPKKFLLDADRAAAKPGWKQF